MSTSAHAIDNGHGSHGGHETEDFEGTYAIWAIPFSLVMLAVFVFIVVLWTPAAASREMKTKEVLGAQESRIQLQQHREQEREALASGAMPIEAAMRQLSAGQ